MDEKKDKKEMALGKEEGGADICLLFLIALATALLVTGIAGGILEWFSEDTSVNLMLASLPAYLGAAIEKDGEEILS